MRTVATAKKSANSATKKTNTIKRTSKRTSLDKPVPYVPTMAPKITREAAERIALRIEETGTHRRFEKRASLGLLVAEKLGDVHAGNILPGFLMSLVEDLGVIAMACDADEVHAPSVARALRNVGRRAELAIELDARMQRAAGG